MSMPIGRRRVVRIGLALVQVLALSMLLQATAFADPAAAPSASALPIAVGIPAPSASTAPVPAKPRLPARFDYSLDIASGFPIGQIGNSTITGLLGSVDAGVTYHITPTTSVEASYFEMPFYPIGEKNSVPLYVAGNPSAIGNVNLQKPSPLNFNVKFKFLTLAAHKVFLLGHQPIVITPGYASNFLQHEDTVSDEINGSDQTIKLRSFQVYFALATLPLLTTPKWTFAVTGGPQWLVRTNGANQTNHAQLFYSADLAYNLDRRTSLFFQPSRYPIYTPADYYPEYQYVQIFGMSRVVTPRRLWFQIEVEHFSPSSRQIYVSQLTCQQSTCTTIVPTIKPIKSTQVLLKLGIGHPQFSPI